ncbi:unnamed protein product [Agarophyton chilense]|eukprot:gb/GEZJ01000647.1/.p1 GENE.gb/GEZJ01000647.1/~~gb/GEZJ01000647.1/.p1  ORF type:complete len:425 (+),score=50.28 gb/GEZJ01000647.1/:6650-7924(+)
MITTDDLYHVPVPWSSSYRATAAIETDSSLPLLANSEQPTRSNRFSKPQLHMHVTSDRFSFLRFFLLIVFVEGFAAIFKMSSEQVTFGGMGKTETALRARLLDGPHIEVVRFMTLNTFIRPIGVGIGDYKDQRLQDLSDILVSFDIICLQELYNLSGYRKPNFLRELAQTNGLKYHTISPSPGFKGLLSYPPKIIDGGLAIVSRFEIVQTGFKTYSRANIQSIDFIVAKGALYARIAIPTNNSSSCITHIFTTHMQANNGLDIDFNSTRRTQLEELVQFVIEKTKDLPNSPIILAGDFNVNGRRGGNDGSSSDEYLEVISMLRKIPNKPPLRDILYEASENRHPVTGAGGLRGDSQKNESLDYIFFSPGAAEETASACNVTIIPNSVRVEPGKVPGRPYRTVSDHYSVVSNFKFESERDSSQKP